MKLSSNFAMLDVKEGRYELREHFRSGGNPLRPCREDLRVPVTIHGYVDLVCGRDDGVSIEYRVVVTDLQTEACSVTEADA